MPPHRAVSAVDMAGPSAQVSDDGLSDTCSRFEDSYWQCAPRRPHAVLAPGYSQVSCCERLETAGRPGVIEMPSKVPDSLITSLIDLLRTSVHITPIQHGRC